MRTELPQPACFLEIASSIDLRQWLLNLLSHDWANREPNPATERQQEGPMQAK
jgi:hypothetical protein